MAPKNSKAAQSTKARKGKPASGDSMPVETPVAEQALAPEVQEDQAPDQISELREMVYDLRAQLLNLTVAFNDDLDALRAWVALLESPPVVEQEKVPEGKNLQKSEQVAGEAAAEHRDNMQMTRFHKLLSMRNTLKILNPKLMVDGRHLATNVSAICGFKVDQEMMDEAYKMLDAER